MSTFERLIHELDQMGLQIDEVNRCLVVDEMSFSTEKYSIFTRQQV
jgi:hypothetical protein